MKVLSEVIGNSVIADYNMNEDKIDGLENLIIVISNGADKCFSIFKHLSNVEKIATSRRAVIGIIGDSVLKSAKQTLLRIGSSFQVIYTSGNYILTNESFAESCFKLHDVLKRQATRLIEKLEAKKIVSDIKKITKYKESASFCRKLVKVLKDSRVLDVNFEKSKIFTFLDGEPEIATKIKIIEKKGEKFIEVNSKAAADVFLEILNDEYVKSEMTGFKYIAPDKDYR